MRLIIRSGGASAMQEWRDHFNIHAPDLEIVSWYDDVDPASVD